jgi:dTDP-4-amino-4,6-dideoxygalactose transaminase
MSTTTTSKSGSAATVEPAKQAFDFLDLKAQFATIREEVMAAVNRVMESQHFILGPEVQKLEEEIAGKLGAKFAVGCASGTDALILALLVAGIGKGDEVITTPFSFIATAGSIAYVGATPVFVDIDPLTFNIDAKKIAMAITAKTRAIMPVHLFGLSAELDPILKIAKDKKLLVIEDAAQAIGARYKNRYVGTFGDFGCFSFFPSKNLGGAGDGGLIATDSPQMAERLKMIRVHGSKKKYFHEILGTNSRLHALQAAILRVKLPHLDGWAAARAERADRYRKEFERLGLSRFMQWPAAEIAENQHVYNQFTVRSQRRDGLKDALQARGVPTEIYYPLCLHLQKSFEYLGYKQGQMPVAEAASKEVLSLPVYPELRNELQDRVVAGIAEFYERSAA